MSVDVKQRDLKGISLKHPKLMIDKNNGNIIVTHVGRDGKWNGKGTYLVMQTHDNYLRFCDIPINRPENFVDYMGVLTLKNSGVPFYETTESITNVIEKEKK